MQKSLYSSAITVLCLCLPQIGDTQIYIGLTAGGGVSKIVYHFDEKLSSQYAPSFTVGAAMNYQKGKWLYGTELVLSNKGYTYSKAQPAPTVNLYSTRIPTDLVEANYTSIQKASFYYAQIPVFVSRQVGKKFYVEIGPYFGLALGGQTKTSQLTGTGRSSATFDGEASFKTLAFRRLDWGVRGGLTLALPRRFRLSAYYEHGFANALPDLGEEVLGDNLSARHRAIRLTLAYFFPNIILRTK